MRGNQRVTSDNPEETYNALKKYGSDLVERDVYKRQDHSRLSPAECSGN